MCMYEQQSHGQHLSRELGCWLALSLSLSFALPQALLADKGWLPAAVVSPGASCAKLAETFPEEMCPCY